MSRVVDRAKMTAASRIQWLERDADEFDDKLKDQISALKNDMGTLAKKLDKVNTTLFSLVVAFGSATISFTINFFHH